MENIPVINVQSEVQSLSPTALVEMFIIDTSHIEGGSVMHFHSGIAQGYKKLVWQGVAYEPLPLEASGFDKSAQGTLPRPKVQIANVGGVFGAMAIELDDLLGSRVMRKRTFARYLDEENFLSGNPEANPDQHLPDELWFVERKVSENREMIEWELSSAFDLEGVKLPYRQVIRSTCPWRYRSSECGYTGGFMDENDNSTSDVNKDTCSKRMTSCKARFGDTVALPFGGFPGVQRGD